MDRSSLLQLIQEQQLDPENTGFIGADTFTGLVHSHELPLDPAKLDMLVALAQSNEQGQVCYQELVDLIVVFLCYGARLNKWVLQTYHPEYMRSPLVYHPSHRARAWRFLTYMFMHVGLEQLGFNALLQLMIGVPLEMVHGLLRISLLYLAGVLAGEAELGWDEVSLQAAEDGAGPGVHELRGGPGCVAALLPTTACLGAAAQLHGAPGRRCGGSEHGPDHPAQLRGAPEGPVWLVGGAARLRHLPALRHLLEHLRLRPAGGPHPPTALRGSRSHTGWGRGMYGRPPGGPACAPSVNVHLEAAASPLWGRVVPVVH
ncbi:rhomboid-related protein 1 isoform X10 [Equus przewalskii]|uniref:rhomboid protease n=1 Tax=Equus przewalskii TaxID=9798 RepID=A0ABM4K519_EQUPR